MTGGDLKEDTRVIFCRVSSHFGSTVVINSQLTGTAIEWVGREKVGLPGVKCVRWMCLYHTSVLLEK